MSKKLSISIMIAVLFVLFLVFFGFERKVTLEVGSCKSSYTQYYAPWRNTAPWQEINAKVDIIHCLCKSMEDNKEKISNYYLSEFSKKEYSDLSVEKICEISYVL